MVHKVSLRDLNSTLGLKTVESQRSHRGRISGFFEWAKRNSHCLDNPCKKLDSLNEDMTQISVLSLDEVKRLLKAATLLMDGRMVATVAIGLFADHHRPKFSRRVLATDSGQVGYCVNSDRFIAKSAQEGDLART